MHINHIAIIMDGNGRWAARRGLPRAAGHRAGARAVRRIVESAAGQGVGTLTLYAFSSDNYQRPAAEIDNLMSLLQRYLVTETARCLKHGIRLSVIGRRDRLSPEVIRAIASAEAQTREQPEMHLRLAIDYSARHAIVETAARHTLTSIEQFSAALDGEPVDFLIRTGGEQRLSDFLLWESAYAELLFSPTLWPDFSTVEFEQALAEFARRERRFGTVAPQLDAATG